MHFREYEYVITLAEEKSFSKAAKRLFISQPSLSQYICRIENELGVILFDRSKVPLIPTYEGELYVEAAKKIMNTHRQLINTYDDSKKLEKGRLNIGVTPSKANHPLPFILAAFKKQYPNVDLTLTESSSSDLEEHLEKGLVDICILNLPITSGNIICEPLFTEKILLAAPCTNAFAKNENKTVVYDDLKKLKNEKFVLQQSGQRLRQISNNIFAKVGLNPKIILETRNIETAVKLVSAGMGFAFIPQTFASHPSMVDSAKYFVIDDPPLTWTVGTALRKESYVTKATQAFVSVTKAVAADIFKEEY